MDKEIQKQKNEGRKTVKGQTDPPTVRKRAPSSKAPPGEKRVACKRGMGKVTTECPGCKEKVHSVYLVPNGDEMLCSKLCGEFDVDE